jgi:hypothetical protein
MDVPGGASCSALGVPQPIATAQIASKVAVQTAFDRFRFFIFFL